MEKLRIEALRLASAKAEHASEILALAQSFFDFLKGAPTLTNAAPEPSEGTAHTS